MNAANSADAQGQSFADRDPADPAVLRAWLGEVLLPYWRERTVDRAHGGFFERLTSEGALVPLDYKRTRLQGRQIYLFSHAALIGLDPEGRDVAARGVDFVARHGWAPGAGGFVFKLSLDGRRVLDATRHLYDQAFALFGLAWFHRLTGSAEALALADRTLAFLDARMRDPQAGGYLNAWIEGQAGMPLPRRQNPHMHLVEALLILAETSGRADHLDRARALVELFFARFRTGPHGFVTEYFTADWRPAPGADGARHEPGHHFEWIWILLRYARLAGDRTLPQRLTDLLAATLAHGIDRAPGQLAATFDEIDPQGAPLVTSKRLWPQTETVKALLAAYEAFGDARHLQAAQATIRMIFRHYLPGGAPLFREHLDRGGGSCVVDFVPASSLYHLFLCLAEYLRVLGASPLEAQQ